MKDGILQLDVGEARRGCRRACRPASPARSRDSRSAAGRAPRPRWLSEATDWIERSMPPSMITKVTPTAMTNSVAVSEASTSSVCGRQELGRDHADHDHQQRRASPAASPAADVAARPDGTRSHAPPPHQTMCSISSTCSGFRPGLASKRSVITPSRITRMVWLRPIVSSSVSAVRMMPMPLVRQRADQLVDLLLGADVEAAGRVVEDHDARPRVQPLGEHHLLLVAAREVEAERVDARRADAQLARPSAARAARSCADGRSGRRASTRSRLASVMLATSGRNSTRPSVRRSRGT